MILNRFAAILLLLHILLAGCGLQVAQAPEPVQATNLPEASEPTAALHPTITSGPASPTPTAWDYGAEGVLPAEQNELINKVVADLAARLSVDASNISVTDFQAVMWSDASLGCPAPGMMYAQVVTEGYRINLEAEGETYHYHMDTRGQLVLCQ